MSVSEVEGTSGGVSDNSFHEADNSVVLNELLILMHIEQEGGKPLPMGSYTERSVARRVTQMTGIIPARVTRINAYDTVLEVPVDVSVVTVSQQLHMLRDWEEIPIEISCIMGKKSFVTEVCLQKSAMIEQRGESEREIEQMRMEARAHRDTLSQLVDRVNQQAKLVADLQTRSYSESIPRIPSSIATPLYHDEAHRQHKMTKTPDLPIFSGEIPTPKGETEFDNWIFQIKGMTKTFTDDAIRNAVVANVRGIAKTVVRAVGYDAALSDMISRLEDRFGLGETDDALLLEFHQMNQGSTEKIQDYGSKLQCKFKILQEQFPGRYAEVQLLDRFFSGMQDKMRDSMRFLYTQDTCTFSQLLKEAMKAEAEHCSRTSVRAKAAHAEVDGPQNDTNPEMASIQKQLDSMSQILKGANFKGKSNKNNNNNSKGSQAKIS